MLTLFFRFLFPYLFPPSPPQEVEVLADGATRVLAWHVAKEKTQEEQFNKNKIGRYVTHVNQPATPKCKIRL